MHEKAAIKLMPPQIYEMRRMLKYEHFKEFAESSLIRQERGLEAWLPKFTRDFKIGLLPGNVITFSEYGLITYPLDS